MKNETWLYPKKETESQYVLPCTGSSVSLPNQKSPS